LQRAFVVKGLPIANIIRRTTAALNKLLLLTMITSHAKTILFRLKTMKKNRMTARERRSFTIQ
jgi:hypothetical protein